MHPGYGFLSENEEFCASVEDAGIAWLGPTAKARAGRARAGTRAPRACTRGARNQAARDALSTPPPSRARKQTMHDFALKHVARGIAEAAGVPVLSGSGLVESAEAAVAAAEAVGFPVLIKATGGGGGR